MRRSGAVAAAPIAALAAAALAVAGCASSSSTSQFHPGGPASQTSAPASPVSDSLLPWPGKATWKWDPLPADPQQRQLVQLDRAYFIAWDYAIYTQGASHQWESYLTPELLSGNSRVGIKHELNQIIAVHHGFEGREVISRTSVRTSASLPGQMVVDFCINDTHFKVFDTRTGKVIPRDPSVDGDIHEEEQDAFSQVGGVWKIATIDVFTSTAGSPLINPPECP
jgi:hypothetical protein